MVRGSTNPYPIIAREGWTYLAVATAAAAFVTWVAGWWSVPLWGFALFVLQFFRDPPRKSPDIRGAVVSPADGRIVAVERVRDPWLARDAHKVSVFMNVFNVHSNRSPVAGEVVNVWYHAGSYFNASLDKASVDNERNALWIRTASGSDVTCVQIAGLIARRILCYADRGDRLDRGQRLGFIRFGSRVDLYLPLGSRVAVALGERVYGGSSIVAVIQDDG